MDAHRIDVFDRADDDRVVGFVADNLHLVFFPAQKALVDEDLAHRRGVHARAAVIFVFGAVVGHAAAGAAEGKGGADDRRKADLFKRVHRQRKARLEVFAALGILRRGHDGRLGVLDAEAVHRLAEQLAVFGHLDGLALGADHLDVEFLENAHIGQRERGIEAGLPAHRRQKRVGALLLDDLGDNLGRDRLDIGRVRQLGVGHDRRWVRVDEDNAVALFAQRLAGLSARVIELAGLADNNGPRSDDHDRLDVGSLRHGRSPKDSACGSRAHGRPRPNCPAL